MRILNNLFKKQSENMPEVRTVDAAGAAWLMGSLASLYRKPYQPSPTQAAISEPGLLENLRTLGIECTPIPLEAWLDDACTPPDARILVLGDEPALVLGRKGDEAMVAHKGATRPETLSIAKAKTLFQQRTLYRLSDAAPDSPEAYGWRWFFKAFFSRKKVIRDVLITSFVIQLIALAFPLATQAIVDKVIVNQAQSTLIALGVGIGLFAVFNALISWLRQKLLLRLANVVDTDLSARVMTHLFRLPLRYFESRATGVLINRIHGVERVREFASGAFLVIALEIPFLFVFLALMVTYSGILSGVVLLFSLIMAGLSFACGPKLRTLANQQFEAGAKVQAFLTERVAAHETVKSLQLENPSVSDFSALNRKQLDTTLEMREFGNGYMTFMQLLEQLMNALVLCLGAYLAMTTTSFTIGMLVAFQMFAQRVSQPLLKLSGIWQELQQVRTAVTQLGDVMMSPTERYGTAPTSTGKPQGKLDVQSLGFTHAADRPPLYADLGFSLAPGQVALVTGPSGCGKSTLAKIMLGLYTNFEGFVRIDGRDIRSMHVNELRRVFGVVPQETVLFSGTIFDNLAAGGNANFDLIVQACKLAGIHDTIENLPNGYQTLLGERGTGLSGGQRQRIGIARALLKQPAVLIFDEATSGLDEASSEHIAQTINMLRGKVTMLFIAHKVPSNLKVDAQIRLGRAG